MNQQDLRRVPGRGNYSLRYLQGGRVFSYAHQIDTVISFKPETVLEIGAGGGVVTAALRAAGLKVTTLDVQPELAPDIVGSVTQLPCADGAFDVALCSQVLEHLPFDQFVPSLRELRRVTRRGLILSLPDSSRYGFFSTKLPFIPAIQLRWRIPRTLFGVMPVGRFESSGHYWEIGYHGFSRMHILKNIQAAGWETEASWRVPELPWHHFFKLK